METELLKTSEAAKLYRKSEALFEKWRCYGGGPRYIKVGRSILYRRTDLEDWLKRNERTSTSQEVGK